MKRPMTIAHVDPHSAYRKMLLEKRTTLLAGLGVKFDTLAKMGHVGEEDQAQISHDEFVLQQLNSLDYSQLRLVEEALDRLETGDYGICLSCDNSIPDKRLQALPLARYCVPCQESLGDPTDIEAAATRYSDTSRAAA